MAEERGDMVDIIIENLDYPEDWGSDLKVKLKSWLRKYYRENPSGGKVVKDLEELIEDIYSSQENENLEGES